MQLALEPPAQVSTAPVVSEVRVRLLHYQETQQGIPRIRVQAPSVGFVLAVNEEWSAQGYLVSDAISGASPAYYTEPAGFTDLKDRRKATDLRLTRHWARTSLTTGIAYSTEEDYESKTASVLWQRLSPDRNRSLELGISASHDTINPVTGLVENEKKRVYDLLVSVGQVIGPQDLVQMSLSHSQGRGYFTDPYKRLDLRPSAKNSNAVTLAWNHHFAESGRSHRLRLRAYQDSYRVRSLTASSELHIPLQAGWAVTPSIRLYSQSAAWFFSAPDPSRPETIRLPDGYRPGQDPISFDQRLSRFGAVTLGLKLERRLSARSSADLKIEAYRQANRWSVHGRNTPGLADFQACWLQTGYTYQF